MGSKVHPKVFRLGTTTTWQSKWFASKKNIPHVLREDVTLRKFITRRLKDAGVAQIEIERTTQELVISIYTSKPGVIIGRGGTGIEELSKHIKKEVLGNASANVKLNIKEVENQKLSASLVAQGIASDIERRIPFRRATKRALESVIRAGAKGAKIVVSGRLDGAEISRRERFMDGTVPLHTLRADIDYSRVAAFTTYGAVGIKVWIYKGEVFRQRGKGMKKAVLDVQQEEEQPKEKPRRSFGRRK